MTDKVLEMGACILKTKEHALHMVGNYKSSVGILAWCYNISKNELEASTDAWNSCLVKALTDPRELNNRQRFDLAKAYYLIEIFYVPNKKEMQEV